MSRCFCRMYRLSVSTNKITSPHQNYQCHGSDEFNRSTVGNWNCIYRRDVTGLIYPRNIACNRGVVKSSTYVRQCYNKRYWRSYYTNNWKLQYYCLLNLTQQWRRQNVTGKNVILAEQLLVKAVGVKLLMVISTDVTVFLM